MRERTSATVVACSTATEPAWDFAVWASHLTSDDLGRFRFTLNSTMTADRTHRKVEIQLLLSGRHQVANSVAAAAAALAVGAPLDAIGTALAGAQPRSRWRMELSSRPDGVLVINDTYNANPDSMRAAIDTLADLGRTRNGSQTWAVLGDMLELGATSEAEHAALGRHVAERGISRLVTLGDQAAVVADAAVAAGLPPDRAVVSPGKAEVVEDILGDLGPTDVVLIKASRGLALDTVAEQILSRHRA
jgi:UDP-N-acetylmuramoyl-tripeptide--D-alanyl-D-alanine ligase